MKQTCSVAHISHGISITGGLLHEQFVFDHVCDTLERDGVQVSKHRFRTNRFFKGLSQLKMVWLGMQHAHADVNLVSNWMALYAIWRNLFSHRNIVITWHHHDPADVKTRMTRLYMKWLFRLLSNTHSKRIAILVVSDYWENYFRSVVSPNVPLIQFPNLFDTRYYQSFRCEKVPKQIYLGQLAFKTDDRIFELAHLLKQHGYRCFFTTLQPAQAGTFDDYEVLTFDRREDYLRMVAQSEYSIAFVRLNEGWNRVAHESILVGTQVIAVDKGGLGDLARQSNSLIAHTVAEFLQLILQRQTTTVAVDFIQKYDSIHAEQYARKVISFWNNSSESKLHAR